MGLLIIECLKNEKIHYNTAVGGGIRRSNSSPGDGEIKYRRSSLYSMMINHEGREFGDEIKDVFLKIPVPDKYNNHDLSVKVIYTSEKKLDKNHEEIDEFIRNNGIASRMVGRWFNRDYMTGICDVELVKERGLYNASELDKALASKTQRGNALLEDAGEDLIGNTFLIVNDIRYIDRSKGSSVWGGIVKGLVRQRLFTPVRHPIWI